VLVSGRMTGVILKYPCVCCGRLTMEEPPGPHQICPICFWEDDAVQLRWPDWSAGANRTSLIEAQQNFQDYGACDERFGAIPWASVQPRCWSPLIIAPSSR
jgi:Cysteine-rich CPCC